MAVRLRPKRLARRRHPARAPRPEQHRTTAPRAAPADVVRARGAGGPEDLALYTCGCGCAFDATVSTSVRCPSCGAYQAW